MIVRQIDPKDTYYIRNLVLRPNKPVETCQYKGDFDDQTFHLGGYIDEKLASIASFYFMKNDLIDSQYQYRLRGMATIPEHQGKGLSSALLRTAFPIIKNNNVDVLWCNARSNAVEFYKKVGFEVISDEFDIPDIGPHFLMKRTI